MIHVKLDFYSKLRQSSNSVGRLTTDTKRNHVSTLSFLVVGLAVSLGGCGDGFRTKESRDLNPKSQEGFEKFNDKLPTSMPDLIAAYGIEAGSEGAVLAFYDGNRYFSGFVRRISELRFQIAAAVGLYRQTGNEILATGKKTTCPSTRGNTRIIGVVGGENIVLATTSTSVSLPRIAFPTSSSQGVVVEWGCFDSNNQFTRHDWTALGD